MSIGQIAADMTRRRVCTKVRAHLAVARTAAATAVGTGVENADATAVGHPDTSVVSTALQASSCPL